MEVLYTLRPAKSETPVLGMHPAAAERLGLSRRKVVTVAFGLQSRPAALAIDPSLPEGELSLTDTLIRALHLPLYPAYELAAQGDSLVIGPCVGLLATAEGRRLTRSRLDRLLSYENAYRGLHGALIVFALDGALPGERLVDGYCYNPQTHRFESGRFPFPAAVYRRVGLSDEWKGRFCSLLGGRFFNARFFNKWELYCWTSADPALAAYLPDTRLYRAEPDFFEMLERFGTLYLKPVAGLGGRGIWKARAKGEGAVFTSRAGGRNRVERVKNRAQTSAFLHRHLIPGRSLVQQALPLLRIRGGAADFRCVVQKDQTGRWRCRAIVGRRGRRGSVVSNISSGGRAFLLAGLSPGELPLPKGTAAGLEASLRAFALEVCAALDRYGLGCGTLGLDIGVDTGGRLWLIEVNNRSPDPSIALDAGDRDLFDALRAGPLFYAKALAGFPAPPQE